MEVILSWAAVLVGVIACTLAGRRLSREVRRGKLSRFGATVVYGLAVPVMGAVPLIFAVGLRSLGSLAGLVIFSGNGSNDGNLIGVGLMGIALAFGACVLFAVTMLFQTLIGSGNSSGGNQR
jgi:putative exporter of polyketide antibiotics